MTYYFYGLDGQSFNCIDVSITVDTLPAAVVVCISFIYHKLSIVKACPSVAVNRGEAAKH